jgi:hypothetical protein
VWVLASEDKEVDSSCKGTEAVSDSCVWKEKDGGWLERTPLPGGHVVDVLQW